MNCIKTRNERYRKDAQTLLRMITDYPGMCREQLHKLTCLEKEKTDALLSYLQKEKRIVSDEINGFLRVGCDPACIDHRLLLAVWVLLDFIDKTESHLPAEYPVQIVFFCGDEQYEIIYASYGKEHQVCYAMENTKNAGKRIVIVEKPEQLRKLAVPDCIGYCTVSPSGNVQYYKKGGS